MNALLAPLQYDFMIKALICSAAVGGVCALLSVFLLLKGWSLIGDALSHAVVPGVALAYLWKLPYALGAFTTGILAAAAMLLLKRLPMLRQDAVIGFVFTLFFAAGLLVISLYPTAINLQAVIYGNILGIDDHDLWQMLAISAVSLLILVIKWRDLMLLFFDEIQAVTAGLSVNKLRWLFFLLVSAAVVAALQTVGAILVIALLITPGAIAFLLCRRFGWVLITAFIIGVTTALIGTYLSYFLDTITGAVVVVLQGTLFIIVFAVRRLQHLATVRQS
ncbi:MAG: metal ABC transporter permease [Cardiobacteriaceae bacterium]|nr:metal ABC transporter permease [Cardiobacteriaceae bacterium]